MALPPPQRLCVRILAVLGLLWGALPGSRQKCVFDEVQDQVRLVRAAPFKPQGPLNDSRTSREQPSGHQERTPPLKEVTRSIGAPQPIRIRTWVPVERDNQSEAEKQRLEAAVNEAVRTVSSLLSGEKAVFIKLFMRAVPSLNLFISICLDVGLLLYIFEQSDLTRNIILIVNRVTEPLLLRRDINKYCKFLWRNTSSANYNRFGDSHSFSEQAEDINMNIKQNMSQQMSYSLM